MKCATGDRGRTRVAIGAAQGQRPRAAQGQGNHAGAGNKGPAKGRARIVASHVQDNGSRRAVGDAATRPREGAKRERKSVCVKLPAVDRHCIGGISESRCISRLQDSSVHRRAVRVGVGCREGKNTRAVLRECTRPRNDPAQRLMGGT